MTLEEKRRRNLLAVRKYQNSPHGRAIVAAYEKTDGVKLRRARYAKTPSRKLKIRVYQTRMGNKIKHREYMRIYNAARYHEDGFRARRIEAVRKHKGTQGFRDKLILRRKAPKYRFYNYQRDAKRRGILFELTFDQFMRWWQQSCSYCGDSIETIGLDRTDNLRGYVEDNIVPCCGKCNKMKLEMSQEEFFSRCERIVAMHNKLNNGQLIGEYI